MKLIDKDKVLKIAEYYGTTNGVTLGRHSGIADIIYDEIAKLPTIEAEPVQHGHWVKIKGRYYSSTEGRHGNVQQCSVCGELSPCGYGTPYCAICGAKMNGGETNV